MGDNENPTARKCTSGLIFSAPFIDVPFTFLYFHSRVLFVFLPLSQRAMGNVTAYCRPGSNIIILETNQLFKNIYSLFAFDLYADQRIRSLRSRRPYNFGDIPEGTLALPLERPSTMAMTGSLSPLDRHRSPSPRSDFLAIPEFGSPHQNSASSPTSLNVPGSWWGFGGLSGGTWDARLDDQFVMNLRFHVLFFFFFLFFFNSISVRSYKLPTRIGALYLLYLVITMTY